MALHIYIDTIPHREQRYPTVGDYWRPMLCGYKGLHRLEVRVSDMQNEDYEFLVAIHELIEEHLTRKRGITEGEITAYDVQYEAARTSESIAEPGDNPDAPYHKEHVFATKIERLLADELGVDWDTYDSIVENLKAKETDYAFRE